MTEQLRIPLAGDPAPGGSPERYRRSWSVAGIGEEGQARIRAARVLVVGAGGLGSPVLMYLAAAGVGTLGIADGDLVELSNLQRQIVHGEAAIGEVKARSARARLAELNSQTRVEVFGHVTPAWLAENCRSWDLVIECADSFEASYMVADACRDHGVPLVWGSAVAMSYQVSVFWSRPPLPWPATDLRMLHPEQPPPGSTPDALRSGVLGPVVGQAGTVMATEALKLIAGIGEPLLGRVLTVDAARQRHDVLVFASNQG